MPDTGLGEGESKSFKGKSFGILVYVYNYKAITSCSSNFLAEKITFLSQTIQCIICGDFTN